jgi:hypothetical protein
MAEFTKKRLLDARAHRSVDRSDYDDALDMLEKMAEALSHRNTRLHAFECSYGLAPGIACTCHKSVADALLATWEKK